MLFAGAWPVPWSQFRVMAIRAAALLALLLSPGLPATAVEPEKSARSAPSRGFLWEARRGSERVLLSGTIHVGKSHFFPPNAGQMRRLAAADVFAFEANVFDAQATARAAQRWAFYPADAPGLDTRLDADLRHRLEGVAGDFGLQAVTLWRMKPWMIANTLVVLEAVRAGFSPAFGSEAFLYQLATSTGKRVVEIESVDAQLRLFDVAPAATQIDYLRHALESIETGSSRGEVEQLVSAWERRDADAMEKLLAAMRGAERPAERFVYERVIVGRHPLMLTAIERFAASGSLHLVAVGALHYFGPDGLLEGLRARGFAIAALL